MINNQDSKIKSLEDPGLSALVTIARFHNIAADAAQLRHAGATVSARFGEKDLVLSARSLGLKARVVSLRAETLGATPLPALMLDRNGDHFILGESDGKTALILEPGSATPAVRPLEEIVVRSDGQMLLFASRASLAGERARFDFSWFIPTIVRYRKLLLEVLGVSLVLQLFGLVHR
ncbi:cysteine peptidase family C39 domain-containing protein [Paraburkholderia sp. SIMBA_049]